MESFEKRKRDPFMTEDAYENARQRFSDLMKDLDFPEDRKLLASRTRTHAQRLSFHRMSATVEMILTRYSGGEDIGSIREATIYMFEDCQRHVHAFDKVYKLWEADSYYYAMLWFSWAILFNLPQYVPVAATFLSRVPEDGYDPFMHTLFAAMGMSDFPGKDAHLLHPAPYKILYESLCGGKAAQEAAIPIYLKKWYTSKAVKDCWWYNNHKDATENHVGYWAFETGVLTALNGLDDSSYRNLNFYPRDLVDYGREHGWHKELLETMRTTGNK